MKRRTEKKQAARYFEDEHRRRRRERGHHLRWQVRALIAEVYRSFVEKERSGRALPGFAARSRHIAGVHVDAVIIDDPLHPDRQP